MLMSSMMDGMKLMGGGATEAKGMTALSEKDDEEVKWTSEQR